MKFDYAVGNPPYQEGHNKVIWPAFVEESTKISDKTCMIHPGRWVIPKTTYKNIQTNLLNHNLRQFKYYTNAEYCFSGLSIDGGISITFFDKQYKKNPNYYVNDEYFGEYTPESIVFVSEFEQEAYDKIFNKLNRQYTMETYKKGNIHIGTGMYGFNKNKHNKFLTKDKSTLKEPVAVWANTVIKNSAGSFELYYIEKNKLDKVPDWLYSSRKVMIINHGISCSSTDNGNAFHNIPFICDKLSTGDNVLWFFPKNDTDRELQLIKSLLMTKTARFLMGIKQKDRCCVGFDCIPDYLELAKLLPEDELFTDKWFYKTFNFSEGLINEIETRVSPKVEK